MGGQPPCLQPLPVPRRIITPNPLKTQNYTIINSARLKNEMTTGQEPKLSSLRILDGKRDGMSIYTRSRHLKNYI